ncbi:lytic transglycosylase domain-containing protein [Rhizobium sp. NLR22b]|uniref:lytic transglycosylase domain-containing protein n=1 Tax=Rhizobium sp. NLR22b TaxID=2731115 RepID=UPI002180B2C8|nr:lytic transglycosylase domain-containing protein [Rhizobium sp. NLR22b]
MQFAQNLYSKTTVLTVVATLVGHPISARAAIFEQLGNGMIVPIGGVSADTPPKETGTDHSPILVPDFSGSSVAAMTGSVSATSVILDAPAIAYQANDPPRPAGLKARRFNGHEMQLPKPRLLSTKLSARQVRMRRLTLEVGLRYAGAAGVAHAGLDRDSFVSLFTTMIHRESNFDPEAVSSAGAKGLGQLMPDTARELGVCNPFSARDNLEGAARYLTAMLHQFGSPELALAAYNAGPGAVKKYGDIPPYRETRQYVSDIFNSMGRVSRYAVLDPKLVGPAAQEVSRAAFVGSDVPEIARRTDCEALQT